MCFEAVTELVALKKHQEQKKLDDERKIQLFSSKVFIHSDFLKILSVYLFFKI